MPLKLAVQFLLDCIVDSGDTGGTTDHQNLLQVRGTQACILQSLADGAHGAVHQISGQLVELCAGQGHIQVLGAGSIGGDEGRLIWLLIALDSSIFAFSAASFKRCAAILSLRRSMPFSVWKHLPSS